VNRQRLSNRSAREAWVKTKLLSIPKGNIILDVGAGQGRYREQCSHLRYVSQDFCQYDGAGDASGLQTGSFNTSQIDIVSDITRIPVEDESFDAILCTEVLEHVPYPIKAIQELARVCRIGGLLILTAPFASLTHYAPYHYYSGFNRYFYHEILPANGFRIVEEQVNGDYFSFLEQEVLRVPRIVFKYGVTRSRRIVRVLSRVYARLLRRISEKTQGTEDLCCFGYHILARKED
jgi:ubiquinone/menaquinone biosynthesis C-methylase UbiE